MRRKLSDRYAYGIGLEIGAYHNPFPLNPYIKNMIYVDKWPYEKLLEMRDNDPNLGSHIPIAPVHIIDDGQTLEKIRDQSVDFVVSSHQIEHCFSPLTAIENQLRVLKPGGHLICIVPDHKNLIDQNRKITTLDHLIRDYQFVEEPLYQYEELLSHYREYLEVVDGIKDPVHKDQIAIQRIKDNEDIHFHCWDLDTLNKMFMWAQARFIYKFSFEIFVPTPSETFIVLKRKIV